VARSFTVSTGGVAPSVLVTKARRVANENNATFYGDEKSGSFSGDMVKGTYRIARGMVFVTITDKHWAVPWFVVEGKVREFFQ
jgi:hypothetical protein